MLIFLAFISLTDALSNVLRPAPIAKTGSPCCRSRKKNEKNKSMLIFECVSILDNKCN